MCEVETFNRFAEAANWPMRGDASLAFKASSLEEALGIWRRVKGDRRWPRRAEMTPRLMKSFLANLAVLDVHQTGAKLRFRARVVGTNLARNFGEAPGRYLDEVVPQPFLDRWQAMLKLALDVGGPLRTTSRIEFRAQDYLEVETLYVPLGDGEALLDAILLVCHVRDRPAPPEHIISSATSFSVI